MKSIAFTIAATAASSILLCDILAQTPQASPRATPSAPAKSPKLTPEQRQQFAEARNAVMNDAEYAVAAQRALEAQKAADRIFFAKLLKAAPTLEDYIRYLQNARGLAQPAQP